MMLTLIRNNYLRIIIPGLVFLCFLITIFITQPTFAINRQTIDSSQLTELFSNSLSRSLQGATITKDYYIYTDWGGDSSRTNLIACKRSQSSSCKTIASGYWGHASTVYHKWGSNTVTVVENGDQHYENHCINLNTGEEVSGCEQIEPDGLGKDPEDNDKKDSHWLQGYTWYGDYALRGWGYSPETKGVNKLLLYKDGLDTVYTLPSFIFEMEGVGVNGDTGEVVIIAKAPGSGTVKFYKISSSVLNLGSGSSNERREAKESAARKKNPEDYIKTYTPSVSTYDGVVETSYFGTMQDDSEGCGVYTTLDLIINILTIGIGITATIGIAVSGIIYLTAKGDVAKATKAKRRIYEIVIGLAVYAVIWALLTFLLPEFNPELKACKTLSAKEIAAREANIDATKAKNAQKTSANSSTNESIEQCMKTAAKVVRKQVCKLKTPAERISATAKLLAGPRNGANKNYVYAMKQTGANSSSRCEVDGESSNTYVATVLLASGVDPNVPNGKAGNSTRDLYNYFTKSPKWKKVGNSPGLSRDGDVVIQPGGHASLTVKKPTGKLVTAHASYCEYYPFVSSGIFDRYDGTPTVFRYVGK